MPAPASAPLLMDAEGDRQRSDLAPYAMRRLLRLWPIVGASIEMLSPEELYEIARRNDVRSDLVGKPRDPDRERCVACVHFHPADEDAYLAVHDDDRAYVCSADIDELLNHIYQLEVAIANGNTEAIMTEAIERARHQAKKDTLDLVADVVSLALWEKFNELMKPYCQEISDERKEK